MKPIRRLTVLLGAMIVVSCLSSSAPRRSVTETTAIPLDKLLPYPLDVTRSAILDVLAQRSWTIATNDPSTGIIATTVQSAGGERGYCRCNSGRRTANLEHWVELSIRMRRVTAGGTRVAITTHFEGRRTTNRGKAESIPCTTTGKLETEIFAAIDKIIADRAKPGPG